MFLKKTLYSLCRRVLVDQTLDIRAARVIQIHYDRIVALLPVIVGNLQSFGSFDLVTIDLPRRELLFLYVLLLAYPLLYLIFRQAVLEGARVERGVVGKNLPIAFTADVNQLTVRPCCPITLARQRGYLWALKDAFHGDCESVTSMCVK